VTENGHELARGDLGVDVLDGDKRADRRRKDFREAGELEGNHHDAPLRAVDGAAVAGTGTRARALLRTDAASVATTCARTWVASSS
jgi:hypothetical protein